MMMGRREGVSGCFINRNRHLLRFSSHFYPTQLGKAWKSVASPDSAQKLALTATAENIIESHNNDSRHRTVRRSFSFKIAMRRRNNLLWISDTTLAFGLFVMSSASRLGPREEKRRRNPNEF